MVHGKQELVEGDKGLRANPQIALVGCGHWGKNLCRNFHALGALSAVVDTTEIGQVNARSLAPDTFITDCFDDVLRDDQIQGIALATPAETHADLAIKAIHAGKDVFVEKPMALSVTDAQAMQKVAEDLDRILMVGHLLEYHPAVLKLRELVCSGELGEINYICSNRLNFGKVRTTENALWSFAPHDVAVILRLLKKSPVEVSAIGGAYLTKVADITVSNLRFKDNSRAHVFVSWLHPYKEQRLVIVGDKKMAIFNDVNAFGKKLAVYPQSVEFDGTLPILKKEDAKFIEHADVEPLREECAHFLDCIKTRTTPLTDARSGIEVLKVLHACQASMNQNGTPISI